MSHAELITRFQQAGQGHVFAFWADLSPPQQHALADQAAEIDLAEIARLHRRLVAEATGAATASASELAPAPYIALPGNGGDAAQWAQARTAGEAALRAGRVAAFTVAGGQGTRLGFDGPKGTFQVTPVQAKPLFQVFAEKILAAGRRYGRPIHWFIMTSHANHDETTAFFAGHANFGLSNEHVHFFRQGRLPAVAHDGKIMLEAKDAMAMSPDGHGGSLRALHRSGALDVMEQAGVDILSYFQVDNPLVRCIDAEFVGHHLLAQSEMSSKMVPKAYAEEKVGLFCVQNDKLAVVEYSDVPMELQRETDASGALRFSAGSIAIHLIDREFARRMAAGGEAVELPFHRADKKIPTLDATGNPVKPAKINGVKFELFVFDALPFARNPIVIETARADDFSPVKNADGVDSPETCRADQQRQFARWLRAAGAELFVDAAGMPQHALEISPLFGYDAETVAESWRRLVPSPNLQQPLYLS
ncbi:MAG: UDPGP type 1 family protein [Candidatus Didemnitutus sp.]|nr:UDPGP type 1 family protein [Candidatus Didemnitutus sp.]